MLFPIPKSNPNLKQWNVSLNQTIHNRLQSFKQGRIRELYHESQAIVSKTPREQATNPVSIQWSVQLAADLDNFKTANARIAKHKHAPVALINDTNLHVLQNLHPKSLKQGCIKKSKSARCGITIGGCTPEMSIFIWWSMGKKIVPAWTNRSN
jgi:hypothetical protein